MTDFLQPAQHQEPDQELRGQRGVTTAAEYARGSRTPGQPVPAGPQAPAVNALATNGYSHPSTLQPGTIRRPQEKLEVEHGNVILYRGPNFSVHTVYRPGQKQHPLRKPTGGTTKIPRVLPEQEQRIAASATRMMPKVEPINPLRANAIPIPGWLEAIMVVISLMVVGVAHGYNMFNFPHYEIDEGTYVSSAWSILHGSITPYPYNYAHPPFAWMQIAAWMQIIGGFFTFGSSLNSARVLMLIYAIIAALLVYLIVRRLDGSRSVALLALALFALSPLSIYFQRQVFLDNAGTVWFLVSLYLIVVSDSRLLYIALAGIAFGLAILCKEVFIMLFPGSIYAVWLHTTKFQRKFAFVAFIYTIIALGSTYVLLTILKGEFFPYAWHLPWDTHPHLSIIQTYLDQFKRGSNQGSVADSWATWINKDPLLMIFSIDAIVFNVIVGWWRRKQLLLAILAMSYWVLLLRGGVVFTFYLIPLIPLLALNVAMSINTIMEWIGKLLHADIVRALLIIAIIAAIVPYNLQRVSYAFTLHPAQAETDAMVWVRNHIPRNSMVVISDYMYTDMHAPGGMADGEGATFPHADLYWNVAFDPELHNTLLHNDWNNIDYIVADTPMVYDIQHVGAQMDIIALALQHSIEVAHFDQLDYSDGYGTYTLKIYQVQHRSGLPTLSTTSGASTVPTQHFILSDRYSYVAWRRNR